MKGNLNCPCGCGLTLKQPLIFFIDSIERDNGELTVTSGARCDKYNAKIGATKNSAHTLGLAVDVSTPDCLSRYKLAKSILARNCKRFGWSKEKKFIHFDIATGGVPYPDEKTKEYGQFIAWDYS